MPRPSTSSACSGRRPQPATPRQPSRRSPRTAFWAHRLLQQLGRAPMHRELGLELLDPTSRCAQLLALARAQPRQLAAIDQLLTPPAVDRLIADLEQARNLGDCLTAATRSSARRRNSAGYPFRAIRDLPNHRRGRPTLETGPYGTGSTAIQVASWSIDRLLSAAVAHAPPRPAGGRESNRAGSRRFAVEATNLSAGLRAAGSPVRVVLAPVCLGKVEDFGQILPAEPSFRVDAEALSGRMRLRRGRVVAGYEETGAGLLSADRHVRELAGCFGRAHRWSATRPGRRGQAHPAKSSVRDFCHIPFGHSLEDELGILGAHDANVRRFEKSHPAPAAPAANASSPIVLLRGSGATASLIAGLHA